MKPEDKILFAKLPPNDQLAILLFGECRGEPIEGQVAVGCVVRNRTKNKLKYYDVITAKNQFSCFNSNDGQYYRLMSMAKDIAEGRAPEDLTGRFGQCRWVAYGIVNGALLDNTRGADHYYAHNVCHPSWASKLQLCRVINNHTFMRGG